MDADEHGLKKGQANNIRWKRSHLDLPTAGWNAGRITVNDPNPCPSVIRFLSPVEQLVVRFPQRKNSALGRELHPPQAKGVGNH